jgi:hypothetical protein
MHMVGGDTPRSREAKYGTSWVPNAATSGTHVTPSVAQAGGSGRASVGPPHWPTVAPERTGTFWGTLSCDVNKKERPPCWYRKGSG